MDERFTELSQAVIQIKNWLKKYGNSHTMIIVEENRVRVTEDILGLPLED